MAFTWGAVLPGPDKPLTRIPRPFSHIADWWRGRWRT